MLHVELVTPERKLLSTEAALVTLPSELGELTILPEHIALIAGLVPGTLTIRQAQSDLHYALSFGVVQVESNKVLILAETAESRDEIDEVRAQKAKAALETQMRDLSAFEENFAETEASLARASARLGTLMK